MSDHPSQPSRLDAYLDCFGAFQADDPVCRTKCAIRLRCVIERDLAARSDFLEDMFSPENSPVRVQ